MVRVWKSRGLWISVAVLLLIGLAIALFAHREYRVSTVVMLADTLFCQASVILFWGACRALGNLKMFTSFSYSFKRLHDVMRNRQMKSKEMKEDYLKYRETRPHHDDAGALLIIGAGWLAVSVILSVMVTPIH